MLETSKVMGASKDLRKVQPLDSTILAENHETFEQTMALQNQQVSLVPTLPRLDMVKTVSTQAMDGSTKVSNKPKADLGEKIRAKFFYICDHPFFSIVVFSCILANTLLLSLDRHPMNQKQAQEMELVN
jgi:hypothetical protein